jgi:proteic killer suppression protein
MKIKSVKTKALEAVIAGKSPKGIDPQLVKKVSRQIAALQAAKNIYSVETVPGWELEEKKGPMKGTWSMWVTGNFRLTFSLESPEGPIIDLWFGDYH